MALHALAQAAAKVVLACQPQAQDGAAKEAWDIISSLAVLSLEDRCKTSGLEPDQAMWKRAWRTFSSALKEPASEKEKKALKKIVKREVGEVLGATVEEELWEYEGFLRGLGRMSLSKSFYFFLQPFLSGFGSSLKFSSFCLVLWSSHYILIN